MGAIDSQNSQGNPPPFFATSCKTVTNSKVRSMNRAKRHSPEGLFKKDVGAAPKNSKICLKD